MKKITLDFDGYWREANKDSIQFIYHYRQPFFMVIVRCHCIGTIHIHITPILQISKTTAYNHYYTDYQTDKPPFFHLLAPLYPCIIIQVYDSTAYFSIQLYL